MNDNNNSILAFPNRDARYHHCDESNDLTHSVRTKLIAKLNRVARGEYVLTFQDKKTIRMVNEIFTRNGYPPIDCDLSALS
jgi:hypothetical protein